MPEARREAGRGGRRVLTGGWTRCCCAAMLLSWPRCGTCDKRSFRPAPPDPATHEPKRCQGTDSPRPRSTPLHPRGSGWVSPLRRFYLEAETRSRRAPSRSGCGDWPSGDDRRSSSVRGRSSLDRGNKPRSCARVGAPCVASFREWCRRRWHTMRGRTDCLKPSWSWRGWARGKGRGAPRLLGAAPRLARLESLVRRSGHELAGLGRMVMDEGLAGGGGGNERRVRVSSLAKQREGRFSAGSDRVWLRGRPCLLLRAPWHTAPALVVTFACYVERLLPDPPTRQTLRFDRDLKKCADSALVERERPRTLRCPLGPSWA